MAGECRECSGCATADAPGVCSTRHEICMKVRPHASGVKDLSPLDLRVEFPVYISLFIVVKSWLPVPRPVVDVEFARLNMVLESECASQHASGVVEDFGGQYEYYIAYILSRSSDSRRTPMR